MCNTRIIALILILTLFAACQSSRLKSFENLTLGQEKDYVLDKLGNPTYTERINDQDHWSYIFYEDDIRHEKVIYFLDGYITFLGKPIPSIISAEEQDLINKEKNIQLSIKDETETKKKPKKIINNPSPIELNLKNNSRN
jgi:outer membrane protein assembly factor BamE